MVIVLYFSIVFTTVVQSAAAKLFNRQSTNAAAFNLIKAATSLTLFTLMAVGGFTFHTPTLLFGLAYGVCQTVSMYAGYKALCLGPMAPTSMLVSFSVVIPLLWGLTVGGESLKPLQPWGLLLLLAAMILTNADKLFGQDRDKKAAAREAEGSRYGAWLLLMGVTFLCNGACAVLQNSHQVRYPEAYTREFMLFAMLVCAVSFAVLALLCTPIKEIKATKGKRYGALAGVCMGLVGFLTLSAAGLENASVLFPMISAGTLLGALLCGRFLFGERLRGNHYLALLFGILAVVFLKL